MKRDTKRRDYRVSRSSGICFGVLLAWAAASAWGEVPSPAATAAFDQYVHTVEAPLNQQHSSSTTFLASQDRQRLRSGEVIIEKLVPGSDVQLPGAMLHYWRGTAFAPGATADDFERLMRNFNSYPQIYAPQVLRSVIKAHDTDRYAVTMRVLQKHVLTVVMDTSYDVRFGRLDPRHGWSTSRSTAIHEIADPGTLKEQALTDADAHGFLWRLNTWWTYAEADGGLYLQIESVSLTRSIPAGLGWAVGPFVESVPRESLEFTLRKTCDALKKLGASRGGTR
jgi:hypothetical protein